MLAEPWDRYVRLAGGLLAGAGVMVALVGVLVNLAGGVLFGAGREALATQLVVGGLLVGLVGSVLLLLAPDVLDPGERPGRDDERGDQER